VRHRCLATVVKALYFSTPQQLEAALADLPISSFIASLLGGRDAKAQAYALQVRGRRGFTRDQGRYCCVCAARRKKRVCASVHVCVYV
jgi:hypothetical protein